MNIDKETTRKKEKKRKERAEILQKYLSKHNDLESSKSHTRKVAFFLQKTESFSRDVTKGMDNEKGICKNDSR